MTLVLVVLMGLIGGVVTTVAGLGGGLVMVAVLSVVLDPITALSATAVGLLVGNVHRVWMYRTDLDWGSALPVVLGAVPTALLAGYLISWLPEWLIFALMLAMGGLAIVRSLRPRAVELPAWAGVPVGMVLGGVTATSGGGGLILAPWLIARGLVDAAYVGTVGMVAISLHVSRIVAYGSSGATDASTWLLGAVLALMLPVGNLLGHALRARLDLKAQRTVQLAVIAAALLVAGYGLLHNVLVDEVPTAVAAPVDPA